MGLDLYIVTWIALLRDCIVNVKRLSFTRLLFNCFKKKTKRKQKTNQTVLVRESKTKDLI